MEELCINVKKQVAGWSIGNVVDLHSISTHSVRISAVSPVILTEGFLQSLQTKGQIIPELGHNHFLPNPSKIHHSSVTVPLDVTAPAIKRIL
jgi:hypothetical protein